MFINYVREERLSFVSALDNTHKDDLDYMI